MNIFKKHVKLFEEGFFNNRVWKKDEILDAVQAQKDLKNMALPDIKLTHEATKSERDEKYQIFKNLPFSVGKLDNFESENINDKETLFGDYINVFDAVKKMIDDKLLTTHSVEFYTNVLIKETGKRYKIIITAISLIPAGELPALFEVFKPYMYSLEKETVPSNESDLTNLFEFESKEIFYFKNDEPKEVLKMFTKEKYNKLANKFAKVTGKNCMSFEDYAKAEPQKQMEIIQELIDAIADEENAEGENVTKPTLPEKFHIENKIDALEKKMFKLMEEKVTGDTERVKSLENIIKKIETEKKEKEVFSFLQEHSDPKNPRISPKQAEVLKTILMNSNSTEKITFSLNNKTEYTSEELIKEFVKSLPVQQAKTTKEIFTTADGIKIDDLIRSEYPEGTPDVKIAEDLAVKKFALEHDLDYADAYEKLILNK